MDDTQIKEMVRARYGGIAAKASEASCCAPAASTCCGPETTSHDKARRMGYSEAELAAAPDGRAPSQGIEAQIKNADVDDVSQLGGGIARGFWIGSTASDSSKSRPSRDVDR